MKSFLNAYLTSALIYNQTQNFTQLGDLLIGLGDYSNYFLNTWTLGCKYIHILIFGINAFLVHVRVSGLIVFGLKVP